MPTVVKLPEELIRRIAAGEVIERPASVLKELLENSLDAGARHVTVEWFDAGRKKLRITDDGHGMAPDDARLALERHATSKIASFEDLESVRTFGFRGEALPSIAAVSRFQLTTRPPDAEAAWSIALDGGKLLREGPAGAPAGTTILVEDLFFNTPARLKFLKTDATERAYLFRAVEDAALSALNTRFAVIAEGKPSLTLPVASPRTPPETVTEAGEPRKWLKGASPETALHERLDALWRLKNLGALRGVRHEGRFARVWGWVSDVHASQGSARFQRFYVNNRPFASRRLTHALYEAYRGALRVGRHPVAVLFLDVDPSVVDVNVHPSKKEVRFSQENEMYGFLLDAVRMALSAAAAMPEAVSGEKAAPAAPPARAYGDKFSSEPRRTYSPGAAENRASFHAQKPLEPAAPLFDGPTPPPSTETLGQEAFRRAAASALLQLDNTYLLARLENDLYIFDQHAAAERVLYERLADAAKNERPEQQALLLPWVWELPAAAAALIADRREDFTRLGFALEPFGANAFRVTAVPHALGDSLKLRHLLDGLVEDLTNETNARGWEDFVVRAACRGSVKAGDPLKIPEMDALIKDLQRCRQPWSCPHGRPTFLRLSPDELAKRFRRT